jgi:hypothetical protein
MEPALTDREIGFVVGLLVGEGSFNINRQTPRSGAQVTLKMNTRHEKTLRWMHEKFPGSQLYGPYDHGGRRYLQWMARSAYLRDVFAPFLARHVDLMDDHVRARFETMCRSWEQPLEPEQPQRQLTPWESTGINSDVSGQAFS